MNRKTFLFSLPALGAAIKVASKADIHNKPYFHLIDEMHDHPLRKESRLEIPMHFGFSDYFYFNIQSAAFIKSDSIPERAEVPFGFRFEGGKICANFVIIYNRERLPVWEFRDQINEALDREHLFIEKNHK